MKTNYKSFSDKDTASDNDASIFVSEEEKVETFEDKSPEVEFAEEIVEEISETHMGKTTSKVYLRQTPSTELDPVTDLDEGEEVLIVSDVNDDSDWYQVLTASSREGYIMKQFVESV